jgi:hypothetical protein
MVRGEAEGNLNCGLRLNNGSAAVFARVQCCEPPNPTGGDLQEVAAFAGTKLETFKAGAGFPSRLAADGRAPSAGLAFSLGKRDATAHCGHAVAFSFGTHMPMLEPPLEFVPVVEPELELGADAGFRSILP